jgi:hypothetical protein
MRRAVLTAALIVIMAWAVQADMVVNLYGRNTTSTLGEVTPGGVFGFEVELVNDTALAGLRYDPTFPVSNWELVEWNYGSYGWEIKDGIFDNSQPTEDDASVPLPVVIDADLYDATADNDFHFESAVAGGGTLAPGTWTVADFVVRISADTPLDVYTITLDDLGCYDINGSPIPFDAAGEFGLNVTAEPTTLIFLSVGVAGLAALRRRRSMSRPAKTRANGSVYSC